MTMHTSTNLH